MAIVKLGHPMNRTVKKRLARDRAFYRKRLKRILGQHDWALQTARGKKPLYMGWVDPKQLAFKFTMNSMYGKIGNLRGAGAVANAILSPKE